MIFFTRKPLLVFSSNLFILFEFCLNNHLFVKLFLILPPLRKGHPYERKILSVLPQKDNTRIYILLWLYEFKCYYQEAVWFRSDSLTQLNTGDLVSMGTEGNITPLFFDGSFISLIRLFMFLPVSRLLMIAYWSICILSFIFYFYFFGI